MKNLIYLFLIASYSFSAFAIPLTCVSDEKMGEASLLRLKINGKVGYRAQDGQIWKLHMIGATSATGQRKIVYGSGSVNADRITLTFVKDDFVLGSVGVQLDEKKGYYTGTASIDMVDNNQALPVKCISSDKAQLIEN